MLKDKNCLRMLAALQGSGMAFFSFYFHQQLDNRNFLAVTHAFHNLQMN